MQTLSDIYGEMDDIATMEHLLQNYVVLCATVPAFPNSDYPRLLDAIRRVDKQEFKTVLAHAFWALACHGLEEPQVRGLWKEILEKAKQGEER